MSNQIEFQKTFAKPQTFNFSNGEKFVCYECELQSKAYVDANGKELPVYHVVGVPQDVVKYLKCESKGEFPYFILYDKEISEGEKFSISLVNKNGVPSYSVNDSKIITIDSNKLSKFSPIQSETPIETPKVEKPKPTAK
jgi:hypothetical protein